MEKSRKKDNPNESKKGGKSKTILKITGVLIICVVVAWAIGNGVRGGFTPGDYYESDELDYMGPIFSDISDNVGFFEGFSLSDDCPWNFTHIGIDYFLDNGSTVLCTIPGQVQEISILDNGVEVDNRFMIHVVIRFNKTCWVDYCFEPVSIDEIDRDHQLSLINYDEDDWVDIGDDLALFLSIGEGAHIHYSVFEGEYSGPDDNVVQYCQSKYMSAECYSETMEMIHSFHPDWNMCYP